MDIALAADRWRVAKPGRHLDHGAHTRGLAGGNGLERGVLIEAMGGEQGSGPGTEVLGGEIVRSDLTQVLIDVTRIDRLRLTVRVDVLEQVLTGEVPAALHQASDPAIGEGDLVILAALAAKPETNLRAIDP